MAANEIGAELRESERQADLGPLRTNRAALADRLEEGELFAAAAIGASQLRCGSGDPRTQIAGIDTVLAEAAQTSPLAALALAADEDTTLEDRWAPASRDIQGKVIVELMDVVVMPAPKGTRGTRGFDPSLIEIRWH